MKTRTLLLALCSIGPLAAQAQFPFPDSAAVWVHYYAILVVQPPIPQLEIVNTSNFCITGADTIIEALSYAKVAHCDGDYVGGIRDENGRVFVLPADSSNAYLLYDFNATVGDTLFNVYCNEGLTTGYGSYPELVDYHVTQIETEVDGRKVVYVQGPNGNPHARWIEGIGNEDGLFAYSPINISGYWYGLDCMSYLDTIRWGGSGQGTCTPMYVGLNDLDQKTPSLTAYPNPTSGIVTLTPDLGPKSQLLILDQLGRITEAPVRRTSGTIEVDLSNMTAGMYFAQLITAQGTKTIRILRGPEK